MDDSNKDAHFSHPSSSMKRLRTDAFDGQTLPKKLRFSETEDYEEPLSVESHSSDEKDLNWRTEVCELVGVQPEDSNENVSKGIWRLTKLIKQHQLRNELSMTSTHSAEFSQPPPKPYYTILHRIKCYKNQYNSSLDQDAPFTIENGHLVGQNRVKDIEKYALMNKPGLSFIITKEHFCCQLGAQPTTGVERLYLFSQNICNALKEAISSSKNKSLYPRIEEKSSTNNPHIWVYRERDQLESAARTAEPLVAEYLENFLEYFRCHKDKDFTAVEGLLTSGQITRRYFEYLYAPGDIVAMNPKGDPDLDHVDAFQVLDWPDIYSMPMTPANSHPESSFTSIITCTFKALKWLDFDGCLQEKTVTFQFTAKAESNKPFDIITLDLFPVDFTGSSLRDRLVARGQKFWACRERKLVSYSGWDVPKKRLFTTARFMIDVTTFRQETPGNHPFLEKKLVSSFSEEFLSNPAPPEDVLILMPPAFFGYSMEDKTWLFIWTASVEDVVWNTKSFESLVMEEKTKNLVMALVTNTMQDSDSTDFFHSKGKGLVLLLHGGPGTGKTLTAESVADYAKKPLYRVTCGDLGIYPNEVEIRLKRVLNLGKIWNCVVLLDEAEVFLQERSLQDLQRNALVSVFLRILEYYDGMLILTSNRVGVFDEGFKSRIQLALHYDNLSQQTRQKVWENFFDRIETFDEDIDIPDLRKNVGKLSRYNLNGREIRNAITTARQLASFNGKSLDYSCLRDVIGVTTRFDMYLKDRVNEGLDDDELAKEKGLR